MRMHTLTVAEHQCGEDAVQRHQLARGAEIKECSALKARETVRTAL